MLRSSGTLEVFIGRSVLAGNSIDVARQVGGVYFRGMLIAFMLRRETRMVVTCT